MQSASGSTLVVRATDGTTWTWDLVSNTVVREHGAKSQRSALATGQSVWVGGPVVSGAKDARLIVIAPPGGAAGAAPQPGTQPVRVEQLSPAVPRLPGSRSRRAAGAGSLSSPLRTVLPRG